LKIGALKIGALKIGALKIGGREERNCIPTVMQVGRLIPRDDVPGGDTGVSRSEARADPWPFSVAPPGAAWSTRRPEPVAVGWISSESLDRNRLGG